MTILERPVEKGLGVTDMEPLHATGPVAAGPGEPADLFGIANTSPV